MRRLLRLFLLTLPITLLSCSNSLQTYSEKDPKIDLKGYKSYAWVAPGDERLSPNRKNKPYGKLIVQSADSELQKKGMLVDVNTPDVLFLFETKVEEVAETSQAPVADNGMGYGYGYGYPGYYVGGVPVATGGVSTTFHEEGLLYFNMYDTKTGKFLWSGGAKKRLKASDDIEKVIKTAVRDIFIRLPIKHKTK
jgi:Domain of unknown function (DUF4136)